MTFNENIIPDDFMVDSEPLQKLELSIEGCIDTEQSSRTKTSEARSAPIEGYTADSVGASEKIQVEEEALDSHSTDHPVQRSVRTRNPPIRYGVAYTHASVTGMQEPRGFSQAVFGPENEQWMAAMALEVKSLEAMEHGHLLIDHNLEKLYWMMGSCCKERCDGTSGVVQSPMCNERDNASGRT